MNREQQLKESITEAIRANYEQIFKDMEAWAFFNSTLDTPLLSSVINDGYRTGIKISLQNPSILRHADPEIMKQAGWVREEEWISVEDRLPTAKDADFVGNVLVCDFTVPEIGVNVSNYMFIDEKYHSHWKPLPQPPKQ